MFESTIHFTMTGLLFAGAVPVILAALLWLVGRSVPPAVRDARAGIGGLLLLVLLILSVKAVLSMFDLGHQAGEAVRVIEETGADGIQAATRFAVARESGLPDAAKDAFFNASDRDIVVNGFSPTGYPMRMLRQSPALANAVRPNCEAYG